MRFDVIEATDYILNKISVKPKIGIILGSGLGEFAERLESPTYINFEEIPHFPVSSVKGHKGRLVIGKSLGMDVAVLQGRVHLYEGFHIEKVVFPIRVLSMLHISYLIVTNSAGGINQSYKPGDLMVITDHINLMGVNPLIGINEGRERFIDMSKAYDPELTKMIINAGLKKGIPLKQGVYAALTGPSYETPAEIKMLKIIGADAVGMSTIPEVIMANYLGMKVGGISCITNMAAGILPQIITHEEVIETTNRVKGNFIILLKGVIDQIKEIKKGG